MPGRKSNISVVSNAVDERVESTPAKMPAKEAKGDGLSVEDISLPKSMIARLAKGVLPPNTQIQKDALLALHKSATVFVSYIASSSNENAQAAGKKTIAPHDVIAALKDAEFEGFIPRLEAELEKYSSTQNNKRNTYRKKVKEEKAVAIGQEGTDKTVDDSGLISVADASTSDRAGHDDAERPFKKFKARDGGPVDPAADGDDGGESESGGEDAADDEVEDEDDVEGANADDDDDDDAEEDDGEAGDEDELEDHPMNDLHDELEAQAGIRDEALDDPESD